MRKIPPTTKTPAKRWTLKLVGLVSVSQIDKTKISKTNLFKLVKKITHSPLPPSNNYRLKVCAGLLDAADLDFKTESIQILRKLWCVIIYSKTETKTNWLKFAVCNTIENALLKSSCSQQLRVSCKHLFGGWREIHLQIRIREIFCKLGKIFFLLNFQHLNNKTKTKRREIIIIIIIIITKRIKIFIKSFCFEFLFL